jgi:ATP-dependent DNA ligase
MSVFSVLRSIEKAKGRNHKISILEEHLDNPLLVQYLKLCWDYDKVFGINPQDPDLKGRVRDVSDDEYLQICLTAATQLADGRFGMNTKRAQQVSINLELLGTEEQRHWWRRLLRQDPKIGLTSKTVNQLVPGLVSKFHVRRCTKFDGELNPNKSYILEPKYDGWRIFFYKNGKECTAYSSQGNVLGYAKRDHFHKVVELKQGAGHLCATVLKILGEVNLVLDGEIVGSGFREEAAAAASNTPDKSLSAWIFDCFPVESWQTHFQVPHRYRRVVLEEVLAPTSEKKIDLPPITDENYSSHSWMKRMLDDLIRRRGFDRHDQQIPGPSLMEFVDEPIRLTPFTPINSAKQAIEISKKLIAEKMAEGGIVKDFDSIYELRRSGDWRKIKSEIDQEFKIINVVWRHKEPALIIDLGNGKRASVGNLSDKEAAYFWLNRWDGDHEIGRRPQKELSHDGEPNPEAIGRWATIRFQQWTKDDNIIHPRFIRLRDIKSSGVN